MAQTFDIIAATGCPTGIAHTFMAKEALEKAAAERGLSIKVETHGQVGVENELTRAEIASAKAVVVAADKDVQAERFEGKPQVVVGVSKALSVEAAGALIDRALASEGDAAAAARAQSEIGDAPVEEKESVGHIIYKHFMNGVSHMLVFVVAGGVLTAVSFLWGIHSFDPTSAEYNQFAATLKTIGGWAMNLMVPVLAAYIAESIGKRPALVPGFVGGVVALNGMPVVTQAMVDAPGSAYKASMIGLIDPSGTGVGAGFLGGIVAGFLAGYVIVFLEKVVFAKLPANLNGLKAIFLYPLFSTLIVGLVMLFLSTPMAAINTALMNWLKGLQGGSPILLGLAVGCMCAFDMGGPVNKAAYVTGTMLLAETASEPLGGSGAAFMAGVSAACIAPPLATTVAVIVGKKYFSQEEHDSGIVNLILGCTHITEGAIPFSAKRPWPNIPIFMIGSAIAAIGTYLLNIHVPAPHGGFLVLPVVDQPLQWVLVIALGAVVSGFLLMLGQKSAWTKEHAGELAAATAGDAAAPTAAAPAAPEPAKAAAPAAAQPAAEAPAAAEFVTADAVFTGQPLAKRDEVLSFVSNEAVKLGIAHDADELMAAFLKREGEGTTGMMDGFAIPHAKSATVDRAAVIVVKTDGTEDWESMDQQPITAAIALLIPDAQAGTTHLKILSKVAEALMDEDFRKTVKGTDDPQAIADAINARLS